MNELETITVTALKSERREMYIRALERKYRHYLLSRTRRNNRHEQTLDDVLDNLDSADIYNKITALDGFEVSLFG